MHTWTKATCAACRRTIKCRSVSLIRPSFAALCGPCARAAEAIPYAQRTLKEVAIERSMAQRSH